ncbi:hypothetical protein BDW72DRAFT_187619 [Aspergillus terricola var. indicus]
MDQRDAPCPRGMDERRPPDTHDGQSSTLDFVTVVTVISTMYNHGSYLSFEDVDGNPKERDLSLLGNGSVFAAYRREIRQKVPSTSQMGQYDTRNTPVVLKKPKTLFDSSGRSLLPEDVRGFLMETQVLSHRPLYWHPNIITPIGISWYLDLFCRNPAVQPQLVLEVADQSLDKFLQTSTNIPFQTRVRIALDITNGVAAVHACGVIHGDIKPANILLCNAATRPDGTYTAKIADFSHSWIPDDVPCRRLVGSSKYRAPEIVRRERLVDYRPADTYSLGVTLWHVLVKNVEIPVALPIGYDLQGNPQNDPYLISILSCIRRFLDRDANERRWPLLRRVFRASLCLDPAFRCLDQIREALVAYLRTGSDALDAEELEAIMGMVNSIPMSRLREVRPESLFINYQLFQRARGPVQDQLIETLQVICQADTDFRRPQALYALGICNLAGLGDPGKANKEAGLLLIHQAAQQGHVCARGYMSRVLDTYARGVNGHRILLPGLEAPADWLIDAAVAGHEVAFEEFTEGGTNKHAKGRILRLRGLSRFQSDLTIDRLSRFQKAVGKIPESRLRERILVNANKDTILHWAAYRNLYPHLEYILGDSTPLDVNAQNGDGDTPLMTACSVGNLEAALCLLRAGADVNTVNKRNETCLHHLWKFTDVEGSKMLHELVQRRINCEIEALPSPLPGGASSASASTDLTTAELDPLPVLPGKAVLRLAARGRAALLHEFLLLAPPSEPRDGNLVRQMIRWASTLTFPDVRDILAAFAHGDGRTPASHDSDSMCESVPLEDTTFEIEGTTRGYMDAVAQGFLSIRRDGWKTPDIWWRICCHGPRWWERLHFSVNAVIWGSSKAMCCHESTLLFALEIHSLSFFRLFLQSHTDNRLEHRVRNRPQTVCTCDNSHIKGSITSTWQTEIRLRPMKRPVDRIFYKDGRTLLHLAIMMGLRQAFLILVHEFHADVERLVKYKNSEDYPLHCLNCYSLLAIYCKDGWFIKQLLDCGLEPGYSGHLQSMFSWKVFLPFYNLWSQSYYLFVPPLLHAFDHGYHFLVRFLLDHGSTLEEPVTVEMTVFDYILAPAIINTATLRFLFSKKGEYLGEDDTLKSINPSLLPRRLFDEGNGLRIFQLVSDKQHFTLEDPGSVFQLLRRAHVCRFPTTTWWDFLERFFATVAFSLYSIPANIIYLPFTYLNSRNELFRKRREERLITMKGSRWLGRHAHSSKEAEKDEALFAQAWNELLRLFPNTKATPIWYREGYGFHRSRSLLAMALIRNRHWQFWGPWSLTTATISHFENWSSEAKAKWEQPDSLARVTADYYTKVVPRHEPSLVNFFLWDDYDLLPSGSPIASALYNMGHRHSLLHFYDVRAILVFIVWFTPLFIIFGFRLLLRVKLSLTLCGVVLLYPSIILASFEKPYAHFLLVNTFILVVWPLLREWPWRIFQGLAMLALVGTSVLPPAFVIASIPTMVKNGLLWPKERYLFNALIRQVEYTGYSPLRLFARVRRGQEQACELEPRRRDEV